MYLLLLILIEHDFSEFHLFMYTCAVNYELYTMEVIYKYHFYDLRDLIIILSTSIVLGLP